MYICCRNIKFHISVGNAQEYSSEFYGNCKFNFLWNCQNMFPSSSAILHFHQWCRNDLISPQFTTKFSFYDRPVVISHCSFNFYLPNVNRNKFLKRCGIPLHMLVALSMSLPVNVCSCILPIFKLNFIFRFYCWVLKPFYKNKL